MLFQDGLPNDRCGQIDRLHTLVVLKDDQISRRNAAIRAIDHRRIRARCLLRRSGNRCGRIAARQRNQLIRFEGELIGGLKRRQRGGGADEFRRGRKLHAAAITDIFAKIAQRLQLVRLSDIAAQRDCPVLFALAGVSQTILLAS